MSKLRYIFSLLLCLCLTSCVGLLVGAAAGVVSVKYFEGKLTVLYEAPYEDTWDASLKALEDLGLAIENKTEKPMGTGKISTKATKDNESVTITVEYKSTQETEVTIRVGLFGDEKTSNRIKDKISSTLSIK